MAPKILFTKFGKVKWINICLFLSLFVSKTLCDDTEDNKCERPELGYSAIGIKSHPITINSSKQPVTVFCFEGLKRNIWHLWSNPVLRISRPGSINESSSFLAYYGESVSDVEKRSQQPGYLLLQGWLSSLRSLQQNEDLSLNPFNMSCYKIDTNVDYTAKINVKDIDVWFIAYLALGVTIFFSARTWSLNTTLHYGSGVSLGILASVIILVFVLSRFLPARLKSIVYLLFIFGTSTTLYMFSSISKLVSDPVTETFIENWHYFVGYVIVVGILSFAVVYRYGPIEDERTLSLIQWLMQFAGLVLVYNSTQLREVSVALVLLLLTVYNFPKVAIKNQRFKNFWYRFFPPKIKLLTDDEYIRQGDVETKKELEKLRDFCRSPDCQSWKIISKLKNPHRFAEFIEGDSWHLTNEELLDYDTDPDLVPPHLVSDDDDNESEMDFVLGSQ